MEDRWVLHKVLSDLYGEAGEFGPKSEIKRRCKYMKHMKDIPTLVFRTMGSSIFCVDSQGGGGFQISTLLNSLI